MCGVTSTRCSRYSQKQVRVSKVYLYKNMDVASVATTNSCEHAQAMTLLPMDDRRPIGMHEQELPVRTSMNKGFGPCSKKKAQTRAY
jgi:hypothetical protein